MGKPSALSFKPLFEAAYVDYHHYKESRLDPISLVHPYSQKGDQEVAAFLVALISYGNVRTIIQSGKKILNPLGSHPAEYLISDSSLNLWKDFKHRFTTGVDIEILAHWLRTILKTHGSLETFFVSTSPSPQSSMKEKLSAFIRAMWTQPLPQELKILNSKRSRNMKYLLSDPEAGSACKRLNMFLRWVVRPKDGVDLGLWTKIKPSELMLPIDTHILQTLQKLRWLGSTDANWKSVEKATQKLRQILPQDPIKYDFALCHLSMSGGNIKEYQKNFICKVNANA